MKSESSDPTSFSLTTPPGKGKRNRCLSIPSSFSNRMLWQEVDSESLLPLTFCLGRNHYWENDSDHKHLNDDGRMMENHSFPVILDCSVPARCMSRSILSVLLGLWKLETLAGHSPGLSKVVQPLGTLTTQDNTPFHKIS